MSCYTHHDVYSSKSKASVCLSVCLSVCHILAAYILKLIHKGAAPNTASTFQPICMRYTVHRFFSHDFALIIQFKHIQYIYSWLHFDMTVFMTDRPFCVCVLCIDGPDGVSSSWTVGTLASVIFPMPQNSE